MSWRVYDRAVTKRACGILVLMVCAAVFFAQAQAPQPYFPGRLTFSPEEEALYLERYDKAQVRRTADEIYIDQEAMIGAGDAPPLPAAAPEEARPPG